MSLSNKISCPGEDVPTLRYLSRHREMTRPAMTIRLKNLYDPQPPPQRKPVAIRPPSPRPPSPGEHLPHQNFSGDLEPRPIMRRRACSLPPSDDRRSRRGSQVRFVDSLGLELEQVKFFRAGEDPTVPDHVINRLLASSDLVSGKHLELSLPYFQPFFPENQGAEPDFLQRLHRQQVCLQQVQCSELGINGTVQVLNLAYNKQVTVHYSFTDWKSTAESKAYWVSSVHGNGGEILSDVFKFRLPVPPFILQLGSTLQFAICYHVLNTAYWDNNNGQNYKLSCHACKLIVPKECERSMVHFT